MKNQKGITLVALVVTIIVLLILAAVSLSLVAGSDGLLSKASNSVDKTIEGSAKEQAELKVAELVADFYDAKYVKNNLPAGVTTAQDYIMDKLNDGNITIGNYTMSMLPNGIKVTGNGLPSTGLAADVGVNGALTNWRVFGN